MKLTVNNQPVDIGDNSTLLCVITQFGAGGQFAVALNGQFVSKQNYRQTPVSADDKIEILSPIQGG
ncbi:MAG: sulfur carrier protein ThiS [Psychrosphaera sp.]|nr:sulfur carrier protein ThiS [Psychrosphaera sp.]